MDFDFNSATFIKIPRTKESLFGTSGSFIQDYSGGHCTKSQQPQVSIVYEVIRVMLLKIVKIRFAFSAPAFETGTAGSNLVNRTNRLFSGLY
jgi:hypothetical protein